MARVIRYRVHNLAADRLPTLHQRFDELAGARQWRSEPLWLASGESRGLFEGEYFRHLIDADRARAAGEAGGETDLDPPGPDPAEAGAERVSDISAAGFLKMRGDELDALVLLFFLRDISAEFGVRVVWHDDENPLLKLRFLEFRSGLLPTGQTLEDHLAKRPIIKKVEGLAITFYPPGYQLHRLESPPGTRWGYALHGLRAYAPTLLEAESEAMKIARAHRHLG